MSGLRFDLSKFIDVVGFKEEQRIALRAEHLANTTFKVAIHSHDRVLAGDDLLH